MAIKIKLTERQQKLAAGEIDGDEPMDTAEALRDAGFDFVDSNDEGDGDEEDDALQPSGEYIEDGQESSGSSDNSDGNPSWVNDRVRSYAASYGLSDDDLASFDDFDALQRFGTVMDRRLAGAVQSGGEQSPEGAGDSKKSDSQGADSKSPSLLDRLKPLDRKRYEEANYGEAELELVDQLNGAIEAIRQIAPGFMQQQEKLAAQQKEQEMAEFHQALDQFDKNLYGRAYENGKPKGKLSEAFESNRRAVMETMERLSQGIVADAAKRGVQAQLPPISVLAQRAAAIVTGTLPSNGQQGGGQQGGSRVSTEQVAAQSRRRRPAGAGGTRQPGTVGGLTKGRALSPADEARAIASNPEIAAFFKRAQRENGVA